jgi:pyridoxal phosphate enzyme (YggS family)
MTESASAAVIAERLVAIRSGIAERTSRDVVIVAVTKSQPTSVIDEAVAAGVAVIGENYAQEVRDKADALQRARAHGVEVHFIGQLQTNKVRLVAPLVDVVQSVDRLSLVAELARRAPGIRVCIQVNTSGGLGRGGCEPETVPILVDAARSAGLVVDGLMTVGPVGGDVVSLRRSFAMVRDLADSLGLSVRSMGMSDDHLIAVEEGSTMVRIGTALVGSRS